MNTKSVIEGEYTAPPAVGPRITDIWGTTPEAIDCCLEVAEDEDIQVDRAVRVSERESADRHHGDRPQEGRGGPVQMQPPDALDGDEEVGQAKDEEGGGHEQP